MSVLIRRNNIVRVAGTTKSNRNTAYPSRFAKLTAAIRSRRKADAGEADAGEADAKGSKAKG